MSFSAFIGSMALIAVASGIALCGWFSFRNPDGSDGDKLGGFAVLAGGVYATLLFGSYPIGEIENAVFGTTNVEVASCTYLTLRSRAHCEGYQAQTLARDQQDPATPVLVAPPIYQPSVPAMPRSYGGYSSSLDDFDKDAARRDATDDLVRDGYDYSYGCTIDCSGHEAGWQWRAEHGYPFTSRSTYGNSPSFAEGALAFEEALEERVEDMRREHEDEMDQRRSEEERRERGYDEEPYDYESDGGYDWRGF